MPTATHQAPRKQSLRGWIQGRGVSSRAMTGVGYWLPVTCVSFFAEAPGDKPPFAEASGDKPPRRFAAPLRRGELRPRRDGSSTPSVVKGNCFAMGTHQVPLHWRGGRSPGWLESAGLGT